LIKKTIESIISDPLFCLNKAEIVISDNASTDDTESVLMHYSKKYENIRYSRNKENNGFLNILSVLNMANGEFCKVVNDYTTFNKDTLKNLISIVEENIEHKPQIFFGQGFLKYKQESCSSFDIFLSKVSYWCTYVACFSIWKSDFDVIKDQQCNKMFPHTSLLFLLNKKNKYLINNNCQFSNLDLKSKGGYDLFEVFGVQFLNMVEAEKNKGYVSNNTFTYIKKDLFYNFFIVWYYTLEISKNVRFHFDHKDIKKSFSVHYSPHEYTLLCILGYLHIFVIFSKKFQSGCKKLLFKFSKKHS
jgi:glycosyltransferase involved in cell wall biosynthesis